MTIDAKAIATGAISELANRLEEIGVPQGTIAKAMFCHAVALGEMVDGADAWLAVLSETARDIAARTSTSST